MKNLRELLQEGDPLRYEPTSSLRPPEVIRQAVLASVGDARALAPAGARSRIAIFLTAASMAVLGCLLGALIWSQFSSGLQAAIRFEVRLAEDRPASGLREAKVLGTDRSVYLHEEVVVTN